MTKKKPPIMSLAVDFGASGTKAVAKLVGDDQFIYFLMSPHCTAVSSSDVTTNTNFNEYSAWVGGNNGANHYAVGSLAHSTFGDQLQVKPLKVSAAAQKTCAAISIAAQKLGLAKRFGLRLSTVLPIGELKQKSIYESELQGWMESGFQCPAGLVQPKLLFDVCDVEGHGTLLYHQSRTGHDRLKTAVIMLGYRNASFFISNHGSLESGNCSEIGFHQLLSKVVALTAGYAIEDLLVPVSRYRSNGNNDQELLSVLRFERGNPHRGAELADLKLAIDRADEFYAHQIQTWLSESLPGQIDEIVLTGGTATYIVGKIAPFLGTCTKSGRELHLYDKEKLLPPDIAGIENGFRFLDIYGLWNHVNSLHTS